ncbi:unnamed protein product, partial [Timema podura]|nr:unnamed protein product [Timema podura]
MLNGKYKCSVALCERRPVDPPAPDGLTAVLLLSGNFLVWWRDCAMLTSTSLSFAVGYKYVSRHFDNRAKKS